MKKSCLTAVLLIGAAVVVLAITFLIGSFVVSDMMAGSMQKTLVNIKSESDYMPIVSVSGIVYMDGKSHNLYECVKDYSEDYLLSRVLCVYNGRFYVDIHGDNQNRYIASIGAEKMDLTIHSQLGDMDYGTFTEECVAYRDGIVTVTNGVNVLEYNILSDEFEFFPADEYVFEKPSDDCLVIRKDSETIELKCNGQSHIFAFADIAQNSEGAAKLYHFKTKKTWSGESRFGGLYVSDSWSTVDGRIYAVVKCMSFDGTLFASVIEYSVIENKWVYVSGGYNCGGSVEGDYAFKIVPRL